MAPNTTPTTASPHMLPLSRYLVERRRALRAEYPDADRDDIAAVMAGETDKWVAAVQSYERGAVIAPAVYRSFRYHVGHAEASRAFRYAGNFAQLANLPAYVGTGEAR